MIESIEIQNFKSVGELQRIPFAPLTLLLGPNSAGKSSVMDALAAFAKVTRPSSLSGPIDVGGELREFDISKLRRVGAAEDEPTILRVELRTTGVGWLLDEQGWYRPMTEFFDPSLLFLPATKIGEPAQEWSEWLRVAASDCLLDCPRDEPRQMRIGWRSLHGAVEKGSLLDFLDSYCSAVSGLYELWVDGRLVLMVSDNVLDSSSGVRRGSFLTAEQVSVVVIDGSHPCMQPIFEDCKVGHADLGKEARFEAAPATRVIGLQEQALADFEADPEDLLVLLHDPRSGPTIHLRDLDWTESQVEKALRYEGHGGDEDTFDELIDLWRDLLWRGPVERYEKDEPSGGVGWMVKESSANKLSVSIHGLVLTLGLEATVLRTRLADSNSVPALRTTIRADQSLEEQMGIADTYSSYRNTHDWKKARSHRGITRETLELASEWMAREDRLGLNVEIVVDETIELDSTKDAVKTIMRRGGSGKFVSDTIDQTGRVRSFVKFRDLSTGAILSASDLGQGVSQVLPVACGAVIGGQTDAWRFMQQPELHLHPRVEARLGDLLMFGIKKSRLTRADEWIGSGRGEFLVETHSEHLVLRLLRRIREAGRGRIDPAIAEMMDELASLGRVLREEKKSRLWMKNKEEEVLKIDRMFDSELATWIKPDDIAVIYAEPTPDGTVYHHLRIDEDGEFIDPWPDGFFPERAEELRP
ncbi:DUF3696 domain-containing protein [bacterium]|nr:DUF3696 domain-containing protein [bacterium]